MNIVSSHFFIRLPLIVVLALGVGTKVAVAQEPAEARAIVSCLAEDDPDRLGV